MNDESLEIRLKALRTPLEGVSNIVKFNWPFYLVSAGVLIAWRVVIQLIPTFFLAPVGIIVVLITTWFVISLLVSFIVYDLSDLYKFRWLQEAVKVPPVQILNIHAGFDETSKGLQLLFPEAKIESFDFYSTDRTSEPSIARARAAAIKTDSGDIAAIQPVSVDISGWKLENDCQDLVLLFMSAHELRKPADREVLFREVHRVLKPDGELIVVEHVRDVANFIAFGPGFMHFYPRSEWLRLAEVCNFRLREEKTIEILVRVFYLCKR